MGNKFITILSNLIALIFFIFTILKTTQHLGNYFLFILPDTTRPLALKHKIIQKQKNECIALY